jgi:predicted transcriptional regulator
MGLVEVKMKILEKLWEEQQPMKAKDVAQKMNLGVAAVTMHLLGLKNLGYVSTPKHTYYAITDKGKETIGLPKIDKAHATKILSTVPNDKAFHFYTGMHQYTNILASSLADFCDKIHKIDVRSVEFHVPRKDFENWFQSLGDVELAKRLGLIRGMHFYGRELRRKVYESVKNRLEELKNIHG